MKKSVVSVSLVCGILSFTQCGPAAEDRVKMHENANHIADSISKSIDEAMAKGAIPNTVPTKSVAIDTTSKK